MDPKMIQNRPPEAAKTLLEPGCRWKLFSEPCWALFLTPPPEPRKSCSRLGAVLIFAKIAYGAREPKIDPKMSPTSSPKAPPEASTRLKLSIQDGAFFNQIPAQI